MTEFIDAAQQERALVARPDVADMRDHYYTPSLAALHQTVIPKASDLHIRDQGILPSCVGFALAAVIDRLRPPASDQDAASPVMLYAMARLHDDIPDKDQDGSTLRGALKGFFHNGVCKELQAPYSGVSKGQLKNWELDPESAKAARDLTLGAYYRLNHIINDYHAAINETGAIIVSARLHEGWRKPNENGEIGIKENKLGYHAFAIVGYTQDGFLVQNSWGPGWGGYANLNGVALWRYADWFENVRDAWVLRLGISSRSAFDFKVASNFGSFIDPALAEQMHTPRRQDILGHYLNLDDGQLVETGRFAQKARSMAVTTKLLQVGSLDPKKSKPYKHLLIFAHGAMTTRQESAKRIRAWKDVFKANGIYPMHIMWQTGFNSGVVDLLEDVLLKTRDRMGDHSESRDERLEEMARPLGRKLWRDLKVSAAECLDFDNDGAQVMLQLLVAAHRNPQLHIHFAGVSAGSYLLAGLVKLLQYKKIPLKTATLFAPACSIHHFNEKIRGQLGKTIGSIAQFNLSCHREKNDTVDIYGKSLLHLVSNALEMTKFEPLLGMERDLMVELEGPNSRHPLHKVHVAGQARESVTTASSHQGFEKDVATMNSLLAHILGDKPKRSERFSEKDLSGYDRKTFDRY